MIENVLIGSDIEVFLRDRETKKFISAIGIVKGSKNSPYWIDDEGHAVETDNVAVEFLIPPCKTKKNFVYHINFMLNYIQSTIPRELEICICPSAKFEDDQLNSDQAKEFGCDADFNPYKMDYNPRPDSNTNWRSTGTHIHIGYEDPNPVDNIKLAKAFDIFVGLPSLLIDRDLERKKLYGKAGACRYKPYGNEMRILSSHFISNDKLMEWVWDQTMKAIEFINLYPEWIYDNNVENIINTNNIEEAKKLINKFDIEVYEEVKLESATA